jgi:hypothetical protein
MKDSGTIMAGTEIILKIYFYNIKRTSIVGTGCVIGRLTVRHYSESFIQ